MTLTLITTMINKRSIAVHIIIIYILHSIIEEKTQIKWQCLGRRRAVIKKMMSSKLRKVTSVKFKSNHISFISPIHPKSHAASPTSTWKAKHKIPIRYQIFH